MKLPDDGSSVIYFAPVKKKYFLKWEYYQVDMDLMSSCFSKVIVCHNISSFVKTVLFSHADLVFCWWWHQSVVPVLLSRLFKIPVYVTGAVHMYDESGSPDFTSKGFFFRSACRIAWRFASGNLFISKSQLRQICSHEKVNNPNLLKSSLRKSYKLSGLKPPNLSDDKNLESKKSKIVVLTISWMTRDQLKRKSVYETLAAFKLLKDQGLKNFEWIIAGGQGDGKEELELKIENLGLSANVKLISDITIEEKQNLYERADLYVQPSYYEGFGNAVLEAMSFGFPAIVSRNTAQAEVIGESGAIVEEIDSKSIAKALASFLALDAEKRLESKSLVYKTIEERHLFKYRLTEFMRITGVQHK